MHLATFARRGAGILASTAVGAGALVAGTPAHAQTQAAPEVGYIAQAYGTYAYNSDRSLVSGPTAYTDIACTTKPGLTSRNTTAEVKLKGVGRVGATVTGVKSLASGTTRTAVSTSETAATTLLGGAITAGAITSSTKAIWDGKKFRAEQSSALADLKVLGLKLPIKPAPNTRVDLDLPLIGKVGYLELNKQYQRQLPTGEFEAITTAFHLALLPKNPWLPKADLDLRIGNSKASLTKPSTGYLKGQGFATRVNLANGTIGSGPTSLAKVNCLGGKGSNRIAGVDLGGLGKAGAATTEATGTVTSTGASSKVVNEIAGLNLLNGLVKVDALKSVAAATRTGNGAVQLSSEGSKFVGITVANHPEIKVSVSPNTKINLLGLAEITFYKVKKTSSTIEVTQIEIVIKNGKFGLPIGSKVEIGRAYAGVMPQL
ncbi:choice-of-anchor P family protein [Actinopolymorpha alba]|uniref:choice-of-anchor P family protein n=1 Tax=Actinopolymorpha alba TaxID=533267 RepID=UPI00037C52AA|nr:choice-of-anchor P family protein [Actinopolymorpha alba]